MLLRTYSCLVIALKGNKKSVKFKCESKEERDEWLKFLFKVWEKSQGHIFDMSIADKHFPDKEVITAQEFLESAETGDVLLFKHKEFINKAMRSFSKHEFDQAFMVIVTRNEKTKKKIVNMLEVDRTTHYCKMIALKDLDAVKLYLKTNKEMVHRRLVGIDRENDFDDGINSEVIHDLIEIINEQNKEHLTKIQDPNSHQNNMHTHYGEHEELKFHSIGKSLSISENHNMYFKAITSINLCYRSVSQNVPKAGSFTRGG